MKIAICDHRNIDYYPIPHFDCRKTGFNNIELIKFYQHSNVSER